MITYKRCTIVDGKPTWITVDDNGEIINNSPSKEELKGLREENFIKQKYNNEKLLEFLRQFVEDYGRIPTEADLVGNHGYPSFSTYIAHFGSWNNALRKVGLDVLCTIMNTCDFNTMRKSKRIIGGKSRWVIVDSDGNIINKNPRREELKSLHVEICRMESWNRDKKYTDDELLNCLKMFYEENGRVPTQENLIGPVYPSYNTYRSRFGSLRNALRLVKLDLDEMVIQGNLETTNQRGMLSENMVKKIFGNKSIDASGSNYLSYFDGICPNGQIYEVKSASISKENRWIFGTENDVKDDDKEAIQWYYFLAFNADYTELLYVWRVPGEIIGGYRFRVGMYGNRGEFNIENMKEFDITEEFKKLLDVPNYI
jgi:hypothetical protein